MRRSLAVLLSMTPVLLPAQARRPAPTAPAAVATRAILADLDTYIPKALAEWHGTGVAVGIVKDDSLIYAKGFGVREAGKPGAVDDKTLFAIGSNSKFFTAVAAGMLADDGKLSLDDKVTKHLPWFQLYDPWVTREFTLRDAMSHRSGLGRNGDLLWYGTSLSREDIIRRVRYLVPNTSFRTEFGYQNIMFLTAGQALAAAAGASWDDVIATRIFRPLGMTASSTSVRALRGAENVAQPHVVANASTAAAVIPWRDIDNIAPAGSINSNVQDMARWMRFILANGSAGGQQLLKPRTLADLTSPHTVATRIVNDTLNPSRHFSMYGLGIGLSDLMGVKVLQHTGGIDGMLSFVAMVPEKKLGIVVLTNFYEHNTMYGAIGSRILNAFLGGPVRDWSAIALAEQLKQEQAAEAAIAAAMAKRVPDTHPSRPLAEYAGTYRDELYGDLKVTVDGNALRVAYSTSIELPLQHFHYDTFFGRGSGAVLGSAPTAVRFSLDAAGRVHGVDVDGLGSFTRVP